MGVLERGGEGRVTCLRLFLGLSTLIRACLQAKLTEVSYDYVNKKKIIFVVLDYKGIYTDFMLCFR